MLTFICVASVIAACTTTNQQTNAGSAANEKIIDQYFSHFNAHEWEKMSAMYADTADFKDPSLGPGMVKQTRRQILAKYKELNAVFPDLHDEVIQTYPSGDKHLVAEFVSTGTAADGSKFELPICTIFTIENGMITKDFTYYDNVDEQD